MNVEKFSEIRISFQHTTLNREFAGIIIQCINKYKIAYIEPKLFGSLYKIMNARKTKKNTIHNICMLWEEKVI